MLAIPIYLLQNAPIFYYTIAALGAILMIYHRLVIVKAMLTLVFRKKLNLNEIYGGKSWVLVTGSSEGIGRQFALQFAKEGFNIILLARTQQKLTGVKFPDVKVEIIIADLIEEGKKEDIKDVLPILNGWKDISIIVNNAGIDILDTYTNLKIQKITDLLNINCFALGALNYKFIPYFEQRTKETRKKCACINVGSVAGEIPMPLYNVYSAAKAYVGQLTNNLSKEYPHINWLVLKPSQVSTAMTHFKQDVFTVSASQCVEGALRDLGHEVESNGSTWHKIQSYIYQKLPLSVFNIIWTKAIAPGQIADRQRHQKQK